MSDPWTVHGRFMAVPAMTAVPSSKGLHAAVPKTERAAVCTLLLMHHDSLIVRYQALP